MATRWTGRQRDMPCSGGATCSRSCRTSGKWRRRVGMGHRIRSGEERSREIIDAVAEHIVRSVEEVWQALAERAPREDGLVTTMRAAVLRAWNDLAVEDVEVPEVAPGEVLVRVRACGLCGTDLKMVRGAFQERGWPPSLPFVMGHEWSGEVVALGEGLDDLTSAARRQGRGREPRRLWPLPHVPPGPIQPVREVWDARVPALRAYRSGCSCPVRGQTRPDAPQASRLGQPAGGCVGEPRVV